MTGRILRSLRKVAEYNRIAIRVAEYLNEMAGQLKPEEQKNIMSHTVAHDIGEQSETVRQIIMSYEGGSNGMFIYGPGRRGN